MVLRLRLRQFVPRGEFVHVARTTFRGPSGVPLHTHDFAEVFWIERGQGWHLINGQRQALEPGRVVLMRPADRHTFQARAAEPISLLNVAFDALHLEHLRQRYFPREDWPWQGDELPATFALSAAAIDELASRAQRLPPTHQRTLDLDLFLLALLSLIDPPRAGPSNVVTPWLREAIEAFEREPDMTEGPAALARLTHRSLEHVNRTVRRELGKTTTDLVNDIRLARASQMLRMTSRPIIEVAQRSGFNNLGYFYRVFAARYRMTPRRYRLAAHAVA